MHLNLSESNGYQPGIVPLLANGQGGPVNNPPHPGPAEESFEIAAPEPVKEDEAIGMGGPSNNPPAA